MNKDIISARSAAEIIAERISKGKFSQSQVRRLCQSKKLEAHKDGKTWFIVKNSALKYAEKLNQGETL